MPVNDAAHQFCGGDAKSFGLAIDELFLAWGEGINDCLHCHIVYLFTLPRRRRAIARITCQRLFRYFPMGMWVFSDRGKYAYGARG